MRTGFRGVVEVFGVLGVSVCKQCSERLGGCAGRPEGSLAGSEGVCRGTGGVPAGRRGVFRRFGKRVLNISEDHKGCTLGVRRDVGGVPSNRQGLGR